MSKEIENRLNVAAEIAVEAGKSLLKIRRDVIVEEKGDRNWVTSADRASEHLIKETLLSRFPHDQFFGEEGGGVSEDDLHTLDKVWIVDPLDGTTNYVRGFGDFGISIAYFVEGQPVVGVIAVPTADEIFVAGAGKGAYLNDQRIRVSGIDSMTKALVGTGFPYEPDEHGGNNTDHVTNLLPLVHDLRRAGAAALDLAAVAAGRLDGFWEYGLSAWDVAAGVLLVTEAGGRVTGFDGKPVNIFDRRIVASNGQIHAALLSALARGKTGL